MLKAARIWRAYPEHKVALARNGNEIWLLAAKRRGQFVEKTKHPWLREHAESQALNFPDVDEVVYFMGDENFSAKIWSTKQDFDRVAAVVAQEKAQEDLARLLETENFRVVSEVYEKNKLVPGSRTVLYTGTKEVFRRKHLTDSRYSPSGNYLHERRVTYQDRVELDRWVDVTDPRQKSS